MQSLTLGSEDSGNMRSLLLFGKPGELLCGSAPLGAGWRGLGAAGVYAQPVIPQPCLPSPRDQLPRSRGTFFPGGIPEFSWASTTAVTRSQFSFLLPPCKLSQPSICQSPGATTCVSLQPSKDLQGGIDLRF